MNSWFDFQAEVITPEIEEDLWRRGILGEDTAQKLIDTIQYLMGKASFLFLFLTNHLYE